MQTSGQPMLRTECLRGRQSPPRINRGDFLFTRKWKLTVWLLILSALIVDHPLPPRINRGNRLFTWKLTVDPLRINHQPAPPGSTMLIASVSTVDRPPYISNLGWNISDQCDQYFLNGTHFSVFLYPPTLLCLIIDASYLIQMWMSGRPKDTKRIESLRLIFSNVWTFFFFQFSYAGVQNLYLIVQAPCEPQRVNITLTLYGISTLLFIYLFIFGIL